jgi:hypothetical protein
MCLIIASQQGILPTTEQIGSAALANPDGWGIAYATNGRIETYKGFDLAKLIAYLPRVAGLPYILHFRIATHGEISVANCHPFKVSRHLYMAHNGMLNIPTIDPTRSDSWHYARLLRGTLADGNPAWWDNAVMDTLGRDIGEGNKMAFLRSDGAVLIANRKRGIEFNGMWLSNSHSLSDAEYLEVYRSQRHIEPVAGVLKFDDNWYKHLPARESASAFASAVYGELADDNMDARPCEGCLDANVNTRYHNGMSQWLCADCEEFYTEYNQLEVQ